MTTRPTEAGASAISLAPRLSSVVSSFVVVGLLLALVLLPLITAGCGPPT